jgi:hypothetical protein
MALKRSGGALLLMVVSVVTSARGQELEPRSYVNTPIGLNFLIAGYGYTQGDIVFTPTSPIEDASSPICAR